jgi:hypothetical protein
MAAVVLECGAETLSVFIIDKDWRPAEKYNDLDNPNTTGIILNARVVFHACFGGMLNGC